MCFHGIFGGNLTYNKRSVLVAIALTAISVYLTLYAWRAHTVAQNIYEDSGGSAVAWKTGPSGSLFPWPREPGLLQILSNISEVDVFIYNYLIKTWVLVGLSMLMWIVSGLFMYTRFPKSSSQSLLASD